MVPGPYIYQLQLAARQVDMLQVAGILSLVTVRHVLKLSQPVAPARGAGGLFSLEILTKIRGSE